MNTSLPEPSLHKSVPLGAPVVIPDNYHNQPDPVTGRVGGIASFHVVHTYIVILDEKLDTPFGRVEAVVVPGTELRSPDGSDWKLRDPG